MFSYQAYQMNPWPFLLYKTLCENECASPNVKNDFPWPVHDVHKKSRVARTIYIEAHKYDDDEMKSSYIQ